MCREMPGCQSARVPVYRVATRCPFARLPGWLRQVEMYAKVNTIYAHECADRYSI